MTCPHTPPCDPSEWKAAPALPRLQSFVTLSDVIDAELLAGTVLAPAAVDEKPMPEFETNSFVISLSREMALDNGLIVPTVCEREAWAVEHAKYQLERDRIRALPARPLTVAALCDLLRVSPEFAAHLIHPGCSCSVFDDDPYLCDWARELGFEQSYEDDGWIR